MYAAEIDVTKTEFIVLEAGTDEFLDPVHLNAVAAHIQSLETSVLEKTFAQSQHDFFADAAVGEGEVSQEFAATQHRNDRFCQLEICCTTILL